MGRTGWVTPGPTVRPDNAAKVCRPFVCAAAPASGIITVDLSVFAPGVNLFTAPVVEQVPGYRPGKGEGKKSTGGNGPDRVGSASRFAFFLAPSTLMIPPAAGARNRRQPAPTPDMPSAPRRREAEPPGRGRHRTPGINLTGRARTRRGTEGI